MEIQYSKKSLFCDVLLYCIITNYNINTKYLLEYVTPLSGLLHFNSFQNAFCLFSWMKLSRLTTGEKSWKNCTHYQQVTQNKLLVQKKWTSTEYQEIAFLPPHGQYQETLAGSQVTNSDFRSFSLDCKHFQHEKNNTNCIFSCQCITSLHVECTGW